MYLRNVILVAIVLAMASFAQAPVTLDSPVQMRYAANPSAGESYIDITNTGYNGENLLGPGSVSTAGNICVNVYAFDATDEQEVACCSCWVSPNQVVNLGVNADLTSKTLTGVIPPSVSVKLVATLAGGGGTGAASTCAGSAATVTHASVLVDGMVAWGTTLHPGPTTGSFVVTETPFTPISVAAASQDLDSIGGRCAAIIGNGSTYGICTSCRNGALGASKM
ncbi:MAG: hypothetical protein ACLQVN_23250 [Bryobacteraceae bacterium]